VIKVGVVMPAAIDDAGEFLADVRALEAAGAEMIDLEGEGVDRAILLGAIAAVTQRIRIRVRDAQPPALLQKLSRGRIVAVGSAGETWVDIPMPADRESWTATLGAQEAAGADGVIVGWDPRLIDLLRNPDSDDRSDLMMSTG
jgi:hypothetical protein